MFVLEAENLRNARITLTLIFINIFSYISFGFLLPDDAFLYFAQINSNIINEFEIWRLVTSIFIHIDLMHLFSNMIALLIFGAVVENDQSVSKIIYLLVYLISGVIGNLFSLILLPINTTSLGASGAIFGLIGVAFVMLVTESPQLLLFASLYILFFIVASLEPGINIWAHLFGLLGGFLFGYLIYVKKKKIRIIY